MNMKVYLTQEIRDSSGKLIYHKKKRSHSFTLQFLDIIAVLMNHAYSVSSAGEGVVDTGNTSRTVIADDTRVGRLWLATEAPGATTTYGIVIGTGTNAESGADYGLQTLIAEGAGAGQMNYGGTAVTNATQAGGITSFTIVRAMANNSGNSITVQETGIYVANCDSGGTQRNFCILRDLTGATAVGNGQTYTVTYTIQTSI